MITMLRTEFIPNDVTTHEGLISSGVYKAIEAWTRLVPIVSCTGLYTGMRI
jgi:hypothetical protein